MSANENDRILKTAEALFSCVQKNGLIMSADQRVSEVDAATLLCINPATLKNLRQEGSAPVSYRVSVGGCRVSYRLFDLAVWIEKKREEW